MFLVEMEQKATSLYWTSKWKVKKTQTSNINIWQFSYVPVLVWAIRLQLALTKNLDRELGEALL